MCSQRDSNESYKFCLVRHIVRQHHCTVPATGASVAHPLSFCFCLPINHLEPDSYSRFVRSCQLAQTDQPIALQAGPHTCQEHLCGVRDHQSTKQFDSGKSKTTLECTQVCDRAQALKAQHRTLRCVVRTAKQLGRGDETVELGARRAYTGCCLAPRAASYFSTKMVKANGPATAFRVPGTQV